MVTFNDTIYYWSRYKADMRPETRNDFLRVFSDFYDEFISLGEGVSKPKTVLKLEGLEWAKRHVAREHQDLFITAKEYQEKKDAITLASEAAAEKNKGLMEVAKNWKKPAAPKAGE